MSRVVSGSTVRNVKEAIKCVKGVAGSALW